MIDAYYQEDGITIFNGRCEDIVGKIDPPHFLITDPPYGVSFDTNFTRFTGGVASSFGSHAAVSGDTVPFDPEFLISLGVPSILFGANNFSDRLPKGSWIIWDKRTPKGNKNVMSDGETAWLSKGHGVYIFSHTWDGFNRASERRTAFHPTQKPVALMEWIVNRWTKPGQTILDPYMGSGPIAIACRNLGRSYIGIEVEEKYCDIAIERLRKS